MMNSRQWPIACRSRMSKLCRGGSGCGAGVGLGTRLAPLLIALGGTIGCLNMAAAAGILRFDDAPKPAAAGVNAELAGAAVVTAEPVRPTSIGGEPFFAGRTVAEIGRTRIVPFRLTAATAQDGVIRFTSSDPSTLSVMEDATVLAGEAVGFVRILAHKAGAASLGFERGSIPVDVVVSRTQLQEALGLPEVISPAGGALAWGGFAVAVQWMNPPRESFEKCTLVMGDGRRLHPVEEHASIGGPFRIASFDIGPEQADGVLELTPVVTNAEGKVRTGRPIAVKVVSPKADQVMSFEAEEWFAAPRPDRWRRGKAVVTKDEKTSGGAFVNNASPDPPVSVNFDVPAEQGNDYWQMMLVAAGDIGGEALPSVGFYLDQKDQPVTQSSIGATRWHRTPIGIPVQLGGGGRTMVTPHFDNDFAYGKTNRNLRIDRIEFYRVPSGKASGGARASGGDGGGDEAMMAGGAMTGGGMAGGGIAGGGMAGGAGDAMAAGDAMMGGGAAKSARAAENPSGFFQPVDAEGLDNRDTHIGWKTVFDGRASTGLTEVAGRTTYPSSDTTAAPLVTLLVNGRAVSEQRSASPRFWLLPAWLSNASGANTIELRAVWADGRTAIAPVQRVVGIGGDQAAVNVAGSIFKRWTLHDDSWSKGLRSAVKPKADAPEQCTATLTGEAPTFVVLDPAMKGSVRLHLEGRGVGPKLPLDVKVSLRTPEGEKPIATVKVPSYDGTFEVGPVDLPGGEQSISLAFDTVKNKEGNAENRLRLDSLIAVGDPAATVTIAPRADIVRTPGEPVFMADAIVVQPMHPRGVRRIELVVDGKETGITQDVWLESGPFVLPLLTRGLPAGEHTVAVRIADNGWAWFTGPEQKFVVASEPSAAMTTYQKATYLLNHLGFGPDAGELAALLILGQDKFMASRLAQDPVERVSATAAAVAAFPRRRDNEQTINRGLLGTLLAENSVRERYTHFIANHFTTWVQKIDGDRKWDEYQRFLGLGIAPFGDLLTASSQSPAMLLYLDQVNSFAKKINENYARELLELHTVGVHAGYQQADVTALAKLLTGWSAARTTSATSPGPGEVRQYDFRYDPMLSDSGEQRVFGTALVAASEADDHFDRVQRVLETLAAHPETARFFCRKLAEHYVSVPAPEDLVCELAATFHATAGDGDALLRTLVAHPRFWDAPPRLAHPLQFAMRLYRGTNRMDVGGMSGYLRRSRAGLFDCATPDGHPEEDTAYADTNAMIQRLKLSRDLQYNFASIAPQEMRYAKGELTDLEKQLIIDMLAVKLTGAVLSEASNTAAVEIFGSKGNRDEQIREVGSLIGQLPELNLR